MQERDNYEQKIDQVYLPPPAFWILSTDTGPNTAVELDWCVKVLYFRPIFLIQLCMNADEDGNERLCK